jgi:hypothetical protein
VRALRLGIVLALAWGCNPTPEAAPPAVERVYEAGSARLTVRLPKDRINMAESLLVRVEAVVNESDLVELPEKIGSPEDFRVAGSEMSEPRLLGDGRIAVERVYELEPYAPGELTLPPIRVRHFNPQLADGDPGEIASEPIDIQVDTVLTVDPQEADIEDIRDPLTAPLPWGWISAGVVALAALVWWLWRRFRRRKSVVVEAAPPPVPPHETALQRLDGLLRSDLLERGQMKGFYLELTALLRIYIEGQFGLRAPERTTEEFLEELRRGLAFNPQQRELLRRLLQHGDMVKFAELKPTREEALGAAELCRRFIEETRPRRQEPAAEPDASSTQTPAPEHPTMSQGGKNDAAV